MKARKLLGVAVGTVGATTLANRLLRVRDEDFEPFLEGTLVDHRWRGFDAPYVEAGDSDDPDLVVLHGINAAASNHEFQALVDRLAADHHVLAPDLPGFGHADRPPLHYSDSLLTSFVTDFLREETESPIVLASSLTGAYAAAAAREVTVDRLVLVCPTDETMPERGWLRTLFRSPVVGQGLFNLLVCKPSLRRFHADHGYADVANLTDDVLDYEWQTAHRPGARFAPASFVGGFLDPEESLPSVLEGVESEVTLVWGRDADITPLEHGRALAAAVDARLVVFDEAKLLPHVEHPRQFVEEVVD